MLNNVQIQRITEGSLLPISPQFVQFLAQRVKELESQLAVQSAEIERLREAATEALDLLEKTWTGDYQKPNIVRRLRAALQPKPQEPSDESS